MKIRNGEVGEAVIRYFWTGQVVEMIVRKPKEQKPPEEERIPLSNPSEPTPSSAALVSA